MGFDDHEESFVTLNNRNFSKLILDQLGASQQTKTQPLIGMKQDNIFSPRQLSDNQEKLALDKKMSSLQGSPRKLHSGQASGGKPKKMLESLNPGNYEKLTVNLNDIMIENAKTVSKNSFINIQAKSLILKQKSAEIKGNESYPIMLVKSKTTGNYALSAQSTLSKAHAHVSFLDLRICQRSATIISTLIKDVYSCKNLIQRGKRRRFFRQLISQYLSSRKKARNGAGQEQDIAQKGEQTLEVSVDFKKIRIIFYDSNDQKGVTQVKEADYNSPASAFIKNLSDKVAEEMEGSTTAFFRPSSLLVVETGVKLTNHNPHIENNQDEGEEAQENEGFRADRYIQAKITQFTIFLNQKRASLAELIQPDSRIMLLHPTDVYLVQQFFSQKNFQIFDISVSIIEFETSFKQVFMLQLLMKKIQEACKPVTQIFEHIDQSSKTRKVPSYARAQQSVGRGGQREIEDHSDQKPPQSGVLLTMQVSSIYFALIREQAPNTSAMSYLPNEVNCLPLLSLEIKWLELRQKTQITGHQQTEVTFPLELYYFNQKLQFFEPAIERVGIKVEIVNDINGNSDKRLLVEDVLNLNFSVSLYENMFTLVDNLKTERDNYRQMIEAAERENQLAQLKNLNGADKSGGYLMPDKSIGIQQFENETILSTSLNSIKNKTGEILLFKSGRQPAFTEMQPNEILPLDFSKNQVEINSQHLNNTEETEKAGTLFDGVASSEMQPDSDVATFYLNESSSDEDSDQDPEEMTTYGLSTIGVLRQVDSGMKPRSQYRRNKFKFKKSEPNRVYLQVLIQRGKDIEHTLSFDINFDSLSCQRVYLHEDRKLYVICQIQNKDGQKILVVRSPMQVTNNLQVPIEVQLIQPQEKSESEAGLDRGVSLDEDERKMQAGKNRHFLHRRENREFQMVIKPESSMIIPLQACNFTDVQIRPIIQNDGKSRSVFQFEWSQKANICLLQDERDIFEQKPIILRSRMSRNNLVIDRSNNQVFFALNANTYSIRSFIDFNTQQTDFISLRYLSVTAPFTIQNLIPVPITMLFKDIERQTQAEAKIMNNRIPELPRSFLDKQLYDLELRHNSSLQVLYLNPLGNFDFSLAIPGYQHSNYVKFKLDTDEDFELCTDLSQSNYISSGFAEQKDKMDGLTRTNNSGGRRAEADEAYTSMGDQDDAKPDTEQKSLLQTAQFRFVKQKKLLLQMCSQFQSQFNICANIAFVQGFYHISFYAKYWFLNNTQMPLQARVSQSTFSFPALELPFQSLDFDFETAKHFAHGEDQNQKGGKGSAEKPKLIEESKVEDLALTGRISRKDSGETFKTETMTLKESPDDASDYEGRIDYRLFKGNKILSCTGETDQSTSLLRIKPWEAYRAQENDAKGLLAALSQEDLDRVSSIYFTQEQIKEESELESETNENNKDDIYNEQRDQSGRISSTGTQAKAFGNLKSSESIDKLQTPGRLQQRHVQFEDTLLRVSGDRTIATDVAALSPHNVGGKESSLKNKITTDQMNMIKQAVEHRSKLSKTSIQLSNFQALMDEQQAVPLNHTPLSKVELYEAPLEDKDQLKRVVLFSDTPTDDPQGGVQASPVGSSATGEIDPQAPGGFEQQNLLLKICDSEWSSLPFDLTKLQSEPIQIHDAQRKEAQPQSMFEIVSVVSFLPQPFGFSKLICFQPRFLMVNRTFQTVYVVQTQCEELGAFKIFPQETSVFHWTDSSAPLEISVKLDQHEYSGNLRIDGIGEFNLRLKNTQERDSTILNVSISEETNSFYIVFTDVSYAPPYRLENLTKTRFKVAQVGSRQDDFDRLNPFQQLSFAWSYPMQPKLLKISLCQLDTEEELGTFSLDTISKTERFNLKDWKRKKDFIMEITNEKTMKLVKIIYPKMTMINTTSQNSHDDTEMSEVKLSKLKLVVNRLGLSVVNSQAREICYTSIKTLRFSTSTTSKHKKVSVKAGDLQIDNQLLRQHDAIILKREQKERSSGDFIKLKYYFVKNEAIENLMHFKYFIFSIVPFELNLDGSFCDETYKYILDVFQLATKFTKQAQLADASQALLNGDVMGYDPTAIKQPVVSSGDEVEQIKSAFKDFKNKGVPYMETQHDVKKIYIEQFQISEIRLSFTFSSSPILFREFTMNPTLKFFIVLLSNLKNVHLRFSKYHLQNQHMLLSIFFAQLKRYYQQECMNHKQLFKIISSMGLFGSISTTLSGLQTAFKSLLNRPFADNQEYKLKAILVGSLVFVKDSFYALSGSVATVYDTLRRGVGFIVQYGSQNEDVVAMVVDRDLFEDDIEQAQRSINSFSTPLAAVDTQNRIWLKILTREKQNYDVKKRILRKQKEGALGQSQLPDESEQLKESATTTLMRQSNGRAIHIDRKMQQQTSMMYKIAYFTFQGVTFIPRKVLQGSQYMLSSLIQDEFANKSALSKVRPPRFVSFTMELEPYSKKKAFALEILNEINLNVFEAETIQKLYTMTSHVVIITGKRIICVDEHRKGSKLDQLQQNSQLNQQMPAGNEQKQGGQRGSISMTLEGGSGSMAGSALYRNWNIFFKDIYRVSIDVVDRETGKIISHKDLERALAGDAPQQPNAGNIAGNQGGQHASGSQRNLMAGANLKIYFVLKIHYQIKDDDDVEADDFLQPSQPTYSRKGQASSRSNVGATDFGLGGLSGLKVGRKEIVAKDLKVMKRVYTAIQNYSRRSTLV